MKRTSILIIATLLCIGTQATLKRAYVKPIGSSAWAHISNTDSTKVITGDINELYNVLNSSSYKYNEVWIAEGTYEIRPKPWRTNIKIYGGFKGDENSIYERERSSTNANLFARATKLEIFRISPYDDDNIKEASYVLADGVELAWSTKNTTIPSTWAIEAVGATFRSCQFKQLKAALNASNCTIENCLFADADWSNERNIANYNNHASVVYAQKCSIANCTFANNNCRNSTDFKKIAANPLHCTDTTTITNSYFDNNKSLQGGAIYSENTVNISSCSFTNNQSYRSGGAIYAKGNVYLENSFFHNNYNGLCNNILNDIFANFCYGANRNATGNVTDCTNENRYGANNTLYANSTTLYTKDATTHSLTLLPTADLLIDKGNCTINHDIQFSPQQPYSVDAAYKRRISGTSIDVGAFEFRQIRIEVDAQIKAPSWVHSDSTINIEQGILKLDSNQWIKSNTTQNVKIEAKTINQLNFKQWHVRENNTTSTYNPWNYKVSSDYKGDSLNFVATIDVASYNITTAPSIAGGASPTSTLQRAYYSQPTRLEAHTQYGYTFKHWSLNNKPIATEENITIPVTPDLNYTPGFQDIQYIAHVAPDTCNVTFAVLPHNTMGTINAPTYFLFNENSTLNAVANNNFAFRYWVVKNGSNAADTIRTSTLNFTPTTLDTIAIEAYFDSVKYYVSGALSDSTNTNGITLNGVNRNYYADSIAVLHIDLPEGVNFIAWDFTPSAITLNPTTENPCSLVVKSNLEVVANIERATYVVTTGAIPELTAEVTTNKPYYFYGDTALVTATINDGYQCESWNICTDGWLGYECQEGYIYSLGINDGNTSQVKVPITSNTTIYAQLTESPGNTTAVDNIQHATLLTLYPNPVCNTLTISCAEPIITLAVYDMLGRSVCTIAAPQTQLNVAHLPQGIYMLEAQLKDKKLRQLFIKQ